MRLRVLLIGLLFWVAGTLTIRFLGQHLLLPGRALSLYLGSFVLMAVVALRLFRGIRVDPVEGVTLLALPTLILDPFTCIFFASLFPNVAPAAAGLFGGWMLICCGGAVAGAWAGR